METTDNDYEIFQSEVRRLMVEYGLNEWGVFFQRQDLDGSYAEISADDEHKCATFIFAKTIEDEAVEYLDVKRTARHEVFHLLLAPLSDVASRRFINQLQLYSAEEAIVNKLLYITKDLDSETVTT